MDLSGHDDSIYGDAITASQSVKEYAKSLLSTPFLRSKVAISGSVYEKYIYITA